MQLDMKIPRMMGMRELSRGWMEGSGVGVVNNSWNHGFADMDV